MIVTLGVIVAAVCRLAQRACCGSAFMMKMALEVWRERRPAELAGLKPFVGLRPAATEQSKLCCQLSVAGTCRYNGTIWKEMQWLKMMQ